MNIGFIGAGKVGFSLGKYLTERNVRVTGYYSRNPDSSREAADFTNTRQYMNLRHLVEDSDVLFVAIPDSAIAPMWEQLKMLPIQNKIISHFSGSLSSAVFSDIERYHFVRFILIINGEKRMDRISISVITLNIRKDSGT